MSLSAESNPLGPKAPSRAFALTTAAVLVCACVALMSRAMGSAHSSMLEESAAVPSSLQPTSVPEKTGGNMDDTDADLFHTSTREATEEMGSLPSFEVVTRVLTRRGKRLQKHYTVFVARVPPEAKAAWKPQLNEEHSHWRWFPLAAAQQRADLHPVVALALREAPHAAVVTTTVLAPPAEAAAPAATSIVAS